MTDIHTTLREDLKELASPANVLQLAFIAVILIALYLLSTVNYLLFHGIVELAGIAVAFSIFIIVWNTRRVIPDAFFLIIGISFLFFGSIDLVHTLAYKGMGIFPGNSSDLPTQLWIAARYFQSIMFLIATLFIGRSIMRDRKYNVAIIIAACTAACALLFASIFVWQNFPHCFIEGSGLTLFKIGSEYIISLILIATIVILYLKRDYFDLTVWKLLIAAQLFLILGELAFTSYISVFGFMNMLGHLFRLLSVYLFYRAIVVIALTRPYDLILRELKINEEALRQSENKLNTIVRGSPIPQFVIDSSHRVIHWNGALEKYSGIKAEEVIGTYQQWRAFYPFERPCMADLLADGTIEKIPGWYEGKYAKSSLVEGAYEATDFFPHMGPSGTWLHFTAAPIRDIEGRVIGVVETLEDITGRKNAEITVQKLLQFQNSALMNANVLLFVIDPHGIVKIWNKAAESITGYEAGDVVGSNAIWKHLYPEKEYRRQITEEIRAIVNDNNYLENLETTVLCRNGTKKIISWNTRAMTDETGGLSGYIAIGLDITERKRAEAGLIESEERYRTLVESSFDGIVIHRDGILLYINRTGARLLGSRDPDVFIGKPVLDFVAPEFRGPVAQRVQRAPERSQELIHEKFLRLDGITIDVDVTTTPITWEGRTAAYVTFRDITEWKRAEEALRHSEERYRTMSETSLTGIYIFVDGIVKYTNPTFARILGYTSQEMIGIDPLSLVHPDDRAMVRERMAARAEHREAISVYECRLVTKENRTLFVSIMGVLIPYEGRLALSGNLLDITERKRAEEALADRLLFQQALIDSIPYPVFIKDATARFVGCNRAYEQEFKTTRDYLQGKTVLDLEYLPLAERRRFHTEDVEVIVSAGRSSYELPIVYADGLTHMTLYSVDGFRLSDGRPGGLIGMLVDISDRKQMEESLRLVNEKLTMLNSITRHDILNQLMGLQTYLELSKGDVTDPLIQGYIQKEEQAAKAIEQQIEFTRNYQDIGAQAPKWQILSEIISSAIRQLNPAGIDIKVNAADVELFADPLIEKVFYNLMENSLRHGGHVTRMDFFVKEMENGLNLTYSDNGVGITAEDKEKLFRKGFGKHTGLGLFLSREILSITGITITENGEPGKGARFEILVPKEGYRFTPE